MNDKVELVYRGYIEGGRFQYGSEAICPRCGNGNAMLPGGNTHYGEWFECRDCGYKVLSDDCIQVKESLDKKGMGNRSTYTLLEKVDMQNNEIIYTNENYKDTE